MGGRWRNIRKGFEWGFSITLRPGSRSPHLQSNGVLENRHSGAEVVIQDTPLSHCEESARRPPKCTIMRHANDANDLTSSARRIAQVMAQVDAFILARQFDRHGACGSRSYHLHPLGATIVKMPLSLDLEYETPLNTWARQDDRADLTARLARAAHELPSGGAINKYDSMYPRSIGQRTSIAVHARSDVPSTTASDNPPRLTRGNSIASSTSSADTDLASALDGMRILESVDGVLQVPDTTRPHADLICPFQILDCEETFNDIGLWKTHIFAHFRGHPCPETATCFLCERVFDQSPHDQPARAWNEMLSHMATVHFRGMGQRLATVRTDFRLMRWLYNRRIITDAQYSRTQMLPRPTVFAESMGEVVNMPEAPVAPSPASPSPPVEQSDVYTAQASSRRERAARSRPRR
ncbi:hypothetical protein GJ744_008111 [Endocarpon pusillum]|uniref:Uncharacterized protein n=1 Tax=Endocarpon pusillum TaxID=364733 RepID=A0A8H7AHU6_9EURO|nr:hypothetical protein GJ744_008111 [Endocarpon pusillum]